MLFCCPVVLFSHFLFSSPRLSSLSFLSHAIDFSSIMRKISLSTLSCTTKMNFFAQDVFTRLSLALRRSLTCERVKEILFFHPPFSRLALSCFSLTMLVSMHILLKHMTEGSPLCPCPRHQEREREREERKERRENEGENKILFFFISKSLTCNLTRTI